MADLEQISDSDILDYKFWNIIKELKKSYSIFAHDDFSDEVIAEAVRGFFNLKKIQKLRNSRDDTLKMRKEVLLEHLTGIYLLHLQTGKENDYPFFYLYNNLAID